MAATAALGLAVLLLVPLVKLLRRCPDGVRRRGRASTSTAGRRCSTRPSTVARRSRRAGAARQAAQPGGPRVSPGRRTPPSSRPQRRRGRTPQSFWDACQRVRRPRGSRECRVATSVVVPPQPRLAHGRLGPRPRSAQQVGHEDRGARGQQPADARPATPHPVVVARPLRLHQVDERKPCAGEQAHPVAEGAVVLDVRDDAGLVVDLDVRRPVPVGLRRRSARASPGSSGNIHRVGWVTENANRPPGPQHPGRLRDGVVDVVHELQGAEGAEDHVEGCRRRRAARWRCRAPTGPTTPAPRRCRRGAGAGAGTGRGRRPGRRGRAPSASTGPAPQPTSSTSRPATSPSTPGVVLGQALGTPHEAGVAEELAVGGLVLVGVAVPVGAVGPPRLGLVDRAALDPDALRQVVLHGRDPTGRTAPRAWQGAGVDFVRPDAAGGRVVRADLPRRGRGRARRWSGSTRPGRRGDAAPEIDAAVLRLVRGLLPVPEVLEVRRGDAAPAGPGCW